MIRIWIYSSLATAISAAPFSIWAEEGDKKGEAPSHQLPVSSKDGYTINYNTVSIVEYIRFASKICNTNFIFNEVELPFTVTVVSDAPITPENVMATLIQTLRIHGLSLLEQGNNLVIHKSTSVRQPATLVFGDEKNTTNAPIITRVFRLKNANVDSVAAIVRPMISEEALIEVSHETRQLILTDATSVVDKIAALIENLDSPHSSLEIRNFESKYNKPEYLIELASQIMHPIAQGNPFILVPQTLANAIFIVSTPELNEKAAAVLASLDTPPKKVVLSERKIKSENIFVIKLEHRGGDEIIRSLKDISNNLQESGILENDLIETIDGAKWIRETNSLMFVGSAESNIKVKELVASLDIGDRGESKASFFVYRPQNRSIEEIQKSMQEMVDNLIKTKGADDSLIVTIRSQKANPLTNTLLYSGDPATFAKIKDLLLTVDTPSAKASKSTSRQNFFVYKIQAASADQIETSLKSFAKSLENSGLSESGIVEAINNVKYIKETHSMVFVGSDEALKRLQEIVPQFDAGIGQQAVPPSTQFLAYKPQIQKGEILVKLLKETLDNLKANLSDPALLHSLESMKWVKNTNTLLFTGDPTSLSRVEHLLSTLDVPSAASQKREAMRGNYYMYKLQNPHGEIVEKDLENILSNMKSAGMKDSSLVKVLENLRYIKETDSILLTGDPAAIEEAKEIIAKYDLPRAAAPARNVYMFKPENASVPKVEKALQEIRASLTQGELSDPSLLAIISSMKFVDSTHSFIFTGTPEAITKIQVILKEIDSAAPLALKGNYFMYKLQNPHGEVVEEDLENILRNMKAAGMKDSPLVKVLENMRYIKETDSLLLTGDPAAVEEAKEIIAKYDQPRAVGPTRNVFMYRPENVSSAKIEKAFSEIQSSLTRGEMSDPALLAAISSMKYVDSTHSFIFNGTPEAITKIQIFLKEIDASSQAPINVGQSTFFFYKLKYATGTQITASIKTITNDLKKSGTSDVAFMNALESLKYVRETNSLMFTGPEEALTKVQVLVSQFDVSGTKAAPKEAVVGASEFFVYKPQSLSGADLETTMHDFGENLKASGLNDPGLFSTLQTMKYNEKTQSLVFTGDQKSLDRVKQLLKEFDNATNLPAGVTGDSTIQAIDNTSFLVYKLEFHKGGEIQTALRQIAKDLTLSNATVNQDLLNSIHSLQWIEVTNSLLCSGDQETLTRLRELIKNLDIPLKQVFIEVLVIETEMTNGLSFGLEWGGKVKYKDKLATSFNNFIPTDKVPYASDTFQGALGSINPPAITPKPSMIPFAPDFEMGVIGDIIKYNGNAFVSLGSLLNALEQDKETTVVMTPKIIAQDSKKATIFSGKNIPFAGSFVSNQTTSTLSTTNLEYRDVGFSLSITPVLGNSEIITMEISLDSSTQLENTSGSTITFSPTQSAQGITTSRTTMDTTVHVPNKNFLILTGMVNNSNVRTKTGIPCLGGIPILGAAFSSKGDTTSNTNVVIFLRPTIINSLEEMKKLTADQEEFFRNQAGTPALEHNYDEGMELIKSPDDE